MSEEEFLVGCWEEHRIFSFLLLSLISQSARHQFTDLITPVQLLWENVRVLSVPCHEKQLLNVRNYLLFSLAVYRLLSKNGMVSYWNVVFQHSLLFSLTVFWDDFPATHSELWQRDFVRVCWRSELQVQLFSDRRVSPYKCPYLMFLTCFCSEKSLELLEPVLDFMTNMTYLHWTSC